MKLLDRVKSAWTARASNKSRSSELNQLLTFLGLSDTPQSELSEATYFACLKVLSEAVGKLPLKVLQYQGNNGVRTAREHAIFNVLHNRPNQFMTATTFWSTMELNRNHYGNAYALIDGAGSNMKLWPLPPDRVQVWYDDAKLLSNVPDIYYSYSCSDGMLMFGSEEILHFKGSNSITGVKGVSVRDQLRDTINGNAKSQSLLNRLYDSGFTGKAVLNYTGNLNDEGVQTLIGQINKYVKGDMKDRGIENIIPMPLGFSLSPLNAKLTDSQFVEIKQYTSLQIAAAFGIKPYQIGDYTKSSYASAEAQQLSFYVDTLLYILKQYEEEISYKLLSQAERDAGFYTKFNVAVILRADLETQIRTLSTAVSSFIYTPNEARALLDLEAKPGGDKLLGNGAAIPVELAGSQYAGKEVENG